MSIIFQFDFFSNKNAKHSNRRDLQKIYDLSDLHNLYNGEDLHDFTHGKDLHAFFDGKELHEYRMNRTCLTKIA